MPLTHCAGTSLIDKCETGIFLVYQSLILQRQLLEEIDRKYPANPTQSVISHLTQSINILKKEMQ